jgi:hypothetical protein
MRRGVSKMIQNKTRKHQDVPMLLRPGNIGLFRLLVIVNESGAEGIATMKLLKTLGSTGRAQNYVKRAQREGLIIPVKGKSAGHGQYAAINNIITERGKALLKSSILS